MQESQEPREGVRQKRYRDTKAKLGSAQVQIWLSKSSKAVLDQLVASSGAKNRSEVIEQLVQQQLRKG